jgi:hypothetical protein
MKIKATITVDDKDYVGMVFKKENKIIEWGDLEKEQQIKLLNSMVNFHELFLKFIKIN